MDTGFGVSFAAEQQLLYTGDHVPTTWRTDLLTADINDDGYVDVVSGVGGVTWHENDGDGEFTIHTIGDLGAPASVVDMNGDDYLDVLVVFSDSEIGWYENDGSGIFTAHQIAPSAESLRYVSAVDVDRDGHMDVLSVDSSGTIAWYANNGSEGFSEEVIDGSLRNATHFASAADFDSDGKTDILVADFRTIAWYENDGGESFTEHVITTTAGEYIVACVADINEDGYPDILHASLDNNSIRWYENDGSGNFIRRTVTPGETSTEWTNDLFLTDVNGDGHLDFVATSSKDIDPYPLGHEYTVSSLAWYENDGSGGFSVHHIATERFHHFGEASAADIDGDGDGDIVVGSSDSIYWYERLGTPLGEVDFRELPSLHPSSGDITYSFATIRSGYLSVDATFDPAAGTVTLRLLDHQGQLIEEVTGTEGYLRIDHAAPAAGTAYELQVSGTNTNVDLRICNLVSQTGNTIEVFDTDGDDAFLFNATTPFNITVNGLEYHFDDALNFTFNSTAGQDTIELVDSAGDDTLTASPTQISLTGKLPDDQTFSATANNFHHAHAYAKNGGTDVAHFVGSEGRDRVKTYPQLVKLMGPNYYQRAKFFETVSVDTLGGTDWAVMVGSDQPDVVWAKENELRVDYDANLEPGEKPPFTDLDVDVAVIGTEYIVARARTTSDWIELHDSALNDVLIAKPNKVEMMNAPRDGVERGTEYCITARGFRNISAIADQGGDNDSAKLYDSGEDGVDIWAAAYVDGQTWSTMTSPTRLLYEVLAFEHVGGYGFNAGLGENHGTNRKNHAADVDFVFTYGHWEAHEEPVSTPAQTTPRSWSRGTYAGR